MKTFAISLKDSLAAGKTLAEAIVIANAECRPQPVVLGKPSPTLAMLRIQAHCSKCDHYDSRKCRMFRSGHCSRCEFNAYLNQHGAICPATQKMFE